MSPGLDDEPNEIMSPGLDIVEMLSRHKESNRIALFRKRWQFAVISRHEVFKLHCASLGPVFKIIVRKIVAENFCRFRVNRRLEAYHRGPSW